MQTPEKHRLLRSASRSRVESARLDSVSSDVSIMDTDLDMDPFAQHFSALQEAALVPMKEDLADWLNRLLGINVSVDNFMEVLETGVVVCQLANFIQQKAQQQAATGRGGGDSSVPKPVRCFKNAKTGSFFARDNAANFLTWCRNLGVSEACMFESEGLVLQKQPKEVCLCLMELARLASHKYGIDPPGLIQLEKEIEQEEVKEVVVPRKTSAPRSPKKKQKTAGTLDDEVQRISGACQCHNTPFSLERLSEGRYRIGDKIVFIRMLRGRHVMVRVGGGWDTLQHYLMKHDPCKMIIVGRDGTHLASAPGAHVQSMTPDKLIRDGFLFCRANYKTPSK
ncbi:GAS2 [Branchiostoma lanceolatum]|uniref:GAS2 protein n=1 Tax=Branchiostoma lanceolatum TaxID=7740 RepID=A0A8J9W058_BRALA|nr:GAS2 [Branchiostoma lanceolatum]